VVEAIAIAGGVPRLVAIVGFDVRVLLLLHGYHSHHDDYHDH
jgi:hypothetical protein